MLRRSALAGLILLMAGALIISGCSSSSTDVDNNVGDPNSPEFQSMKSAIEVAVDSTLAIAFNFAHKPDRYPNEGNTGYDRPELGPNDSLLYNYVDEWHVLYIGAAGASNYSNVYVDSARYWEGSNAVELFRWDRVTQLDLIRHQSAAYEGSANEYDDISAYVNFEFVNWNQANQQFSGDASVTVDKHYLESLSPRNDVFEFDIEVEDVVYSDPLNYQWEYRQPLDGSLSITGTVTTANGEQDWTVDVSFADGNANISAQIGEVVYQYTMTPEFN